MKNNNLGLSTKSTIWNKLPKPIKILIKSIQVRLGLEVLILTPYMGKYTVQTINKSLLDIYNESKIITKKDLESALLSGKIQYEENAKLFLKYL